LPDALFTLQLVNHYNASQPQEMQFIPYC
jgi:hypothetical protein